MKGYVISSKCLVILAFGILTCNVTAQKASLDTLDSAQLRQQMDKAIKMRNTGRGLVWMPPVIVAISGLGFFFPDEESDSNILKHLFNGLVFYSMAYASIPLMITGGILWAVGSKRIDTVNIALKKLTIMPENSMALGVGITINFRF